MELLKEGIEWDGFVVVEVLDGKTAFGVPCTGGDIARIAEEVAFLIFGIFKDGEFSVGHAHDVKVARVVLLFEVDEDVFADFEASGAGDMAADAVDGSADLADIDFLLLGVAFVAFDDSDLDVGIDASIFGVPSGVYTEHTTLDDGVCALCHLLIIEFDDDGGLCGEGRKADKCVEEDRRERFRHVVISFECGRGQRGPTRAPATRQRMWTIRHVRNRSQRVWGGKA